MISKGAGFLINILFVRTVIAGVGEPNFGNYQLTWSIVLILISIDLGVSSSFRNKFFENSNNKTELAEQFTSSILTSFLISLFVLILFQPLNKVFSFTSNSEFYAIWIFLIPINVSLKITQSINFSSHKPYLNTIFNSLQFAISILIIYMITDKLDFAISIQTAISIVLFSMIVTHSLSLFVNKGFKNFKIKFLKFSNVLKQFNKVNINFQLAQFLFALYLNSFILIMEKIIDANEFNLFALYFQYFNFSFLLFQTLITPIWAEISEQYFKGSIKSKKILVYLVSIVLSSFSILVFQTIFISPTSFLVLGVRLNELSNNYFLIFLIYFLSLFFLMCSINLVNAINQLNRQNMFLICSVLVVYLISYTHGRDLNAVYLSIIFSTLNLLGGYIMIRSFLSKTS